jgi:aryl-alcohol dehydrogenase-like predicted oxidoreductase
MGRTPAQVALRWVLDRPGVASAIAGARTAAQFRESLGVDGWTLPDEIRGHLDEVSRLPDRYPESFEKNMHERRNKAVRMARLPV